MMGWNYPPGVTGYEPEIAGYEEVELIVDCDNEKMEVINRVDALTLVRAFAYKAVTLTEDIERLHTYYMYKAVTLTEDIERLHTYYIPCEYSGYVTGYIVGDGVEWDCPRCGETHTEYP